jgi:hypothetical protein
LGSSGDRGENRINDLRGRNDLGGGDNRLRVHGRLDRRGIARGRGARIQDRVRERLVLNRGGLRMAGLHQLDPG